VQLFYHPDLSTSTLLWEGPEFHHAAHVLRQGEGTIIHLTDGKGHLVSARFAKVEKKHGTLEIQDRTWLAAVDPEVHLFIAPTKQIDRMEWLIEKGTEIGIRAFHPFTSYHSERRMLREDRLQQIALSAMKQSNRLYLPIVHALITWKEVLIEAASLEVGFIAHASSPDALRSMVPIHGKVAILIGPEGDFSEQELDEAVAAGFRKVNLGSYRLRTETAALMAAASLL
jgi:16S rRNA (uracil1498-N3)-methyltransferase